MTRAPAPRVDACSLVVDTAYLPAILQLVDGATQSVDLIAFSFSIGSAKKAAAADAAGAAVSGPLQVARRLVAAAERGVLVRVYLEDVRETSERNRPTAAMLDAAGVEVTYGSSHAKGACADGRRVLFGSTNLSHQSLTKNIEANCLFDDDAVAAGFAKYFEHLWGGGRHGGVHLAPPMIADGDFEEALIGAIDAAERAIDFCIYFFDHGGIASALVRAHRRGVHVRGLVHTHAAYAMSYIRRTRGIVAMLAQAGVRDLHWGPASTFTHAKCLVADDARVFLSTGNWLVEDVEIHPQLSVLFESPDVARALRTWLATTIVTRGSAVG